MSTSRALLFYVSSFVIFVPDFSVHNAANAIRRQDFAVSRLEKYFPFSNFPSQSSMTNEKYSFDFRRSLMLS